jgi:hypothetical protein
MLLLGLLLLVILMVLLVRNKRDTFKSFGAGLRIDNVTPQYTLSQYSEDSYIYPVDSYPDEPGCYSNGYIELVKVPGKGREQKKHCIHAGHCFHPMPGPNRCYKKNVIGRL